VGNIDARIDQLAAAISAARPEGVNHIRLPIPDHDLSGQLVQIGLTLWAHL
jgi:hypothetical protein